MRDGLEVPCSFSIFSSSFFSMVRELSAFTSSRLSKLDRLL